MTPLLLILKGHQLNLEWKLSTDATAIKMADTQLLLEFMVWIGLCASLTGSCIMFAERLRPLSHKAIYSAMIDEFVLGVESEQNN